MLHIPHINLPEEKQPWPWPDYVHLLAEIESLRERLAEKTRENVELRQAYEQITDFARIQTEKLEEATVRAIKAETVIEENNYV